MSPLLVNAGTVALAILVLALLEGLLSADNALVLAVMVRHLPKPEQKKALRYGIWGAFVFRLVAVILASYLIRFWWLQVAGGLYLIFLAARHFLWPEPEGPGLEGRPTGTSLLMTVVNVEVADLVFSIDSILAGVAMTKSLPANLQGNRTLELAIIYLGGVLGIIMMRWVAGQFLRLLDRFRGLASGAYILVGWIGLKLSGSGLHDAFEEPTLWDTGWRAALPRSLKAFPWEIPTWFFWIGMAAIALASLFYSPPDDPGGPSSSSPSDPSPPP